MIEKVSGYVAYAVTSFGGILGFGSEMHTIPWEQLHYDTTLGGYKTSITRSSCAERPSSPVATRLFCRDTSGMNSTATT